MTLTLGDGDRPKLTQLLDICFNRDDLQIALLNATPSRQFENLVRDRDFLTQLSDLVNNAQEKNWLADLFYITRNATTRADLLDELAAMERRAKSGISDYTPFPRADNTGHAAVKLCDRQLQDESLWNAFRVPPNTTHFFLLAGDERAAHNSFMERFRFATLPWLLKQPKESFRDVTEPITSEWVTRPPRGSELPYLLSKLRNKLDPQSVESAAAFRTIPHFAGKIVIIQHFIYEMTWSENALPLIADYIRFWSLPQEQSSERPWFLVFLHFVFDECVGPPPLMNELEQFAKSTHCPGCSVTLLPYLPLVGRTDVQSWLMEHLPGQRKAGRALLDRLFPSPTVELAMEDLEIELLKLVEGTN